MAFYSVLFLTLLLAISTLTVAPSAVEAQILVRIRGTVNCAATVTTSKASAFPSKYYCMHKQVFTTHKHTYLHSFISHYISIYTILYEYKLYIDKYV